MAMKIKTRKEVKDGIAGRIVIGFEGILREDKLPSEYTTIAPNKPCAYLSRDGKYIRLWGIDDIVLDRWYPETTFQKIIEYLRNAGNRLHEINQRIKKLKAEWQGEETFVI